MEIREDIFIVGTITFFYWTGWALYFKDIIIVKKIKKLLIIRSKLCFFPINQRKKKTKNANVLGAEGEIEGIRER